MQISMDSELVSASVYLIVVPVYGLLWLRRARHAYGALAIAALMLALCAFTRSETVRTWELQPIFQHCPTPTNNPTPQHELPMIA